MRSKQVAFGGFTYTQKSFNSDTVRSKPLLLFVVHLCLQVSIPTRCDQNADGTGYRTAPSCWFQFRHGAIKTGIGAEELLKRLAFQFRHGAIKTISELRGAFLQLAFQFRHGAIKTFLDLKFPTAVQMFQFRHGAIKTKFENVAGARNARKFQFRHGAIKTLPPFSYFRIIHAGFNSDTVRSKPAYPCLPYVTITCFNSDTVRSKLGPPDKDWSYSVFQFRHGAIKTYIGERLFKPVRRFNSDTVRSKHGFHGET